MTRKYKRNQMVWLKIGDRPAINIKVVDKVDNDHYLLDWGGCGFNSILNTVRIPFKSLSLKPQK